MFEYEIQAIRQSAHESVATTKQAQLILDTDMQGRTDAFNPAELLLAAVSACMLKGIERVAPMLKFSYRGAAVRVHGWRQDTPPKMERIEYSLWLDTDESDRRMELLHENLRKFGTVYNTVAAGCEMIGHVQRGKPD